MDQDLVSANPTAAASDAVAAPSSSAAVPNDMTQTDNAVQVDDAVQTDYTAVRDAGMPADAAAAGVATDDARPATEELIGAMDEAMEPLPAEALEVAEKIAESQNVLVALSSDPTVDEMAAAIGLTLFLDKLGKHTTAIYSGNTPNALQFLKPEETFETSADALQDFVIALNKDKADHLRYKLDGDFVKIFITPYKTRVSKEDLTFSYGDYNVDLVLALEVANGIDLDSALREHGRIMHDAVIVNVTTENPGKLGEIEWSDKRASSVSEMIARMLYSVSRDKIEKDEATAFLTGIVAATNRFSNAKTTPETMQVAARLMRSGANQQLISKNITPEIDNELIAALKDNAKVKAVENGKTGEKLNETGTTDDKVEEKADESAEPESQKSAEEDDPTQLSIGHDKSEKSTAKETDKTEESLPKTEELAEVEELVKTEELTRSESAPTEETVAEETAPEEDTVEVGTVGPIGPVGGNEEQETAPAPEAGPTEEEKEMMRTEPEKVLEPSAEIEAPAPVLNANAAPVSVENPAMAAAPQVATKPEINGVPEMNFTPPADAEILPPPPAPQIDIGEPGGMPPETLMAPIEPASPPDNGPAPLAAQPDIVQVSASPAQAEQANEQPAAAPAAPASEPSVAQPAPDLGAFKIPGM